MDFRSRVFAELDLLPKRNGRSKLAVATLKRWSGELSRLIYDVRMMKNGSELRSCERSCGRPERIVRRRNERGERACSLFCRSTLIYCRRYFLVGASWRLPHHRARQWRVRLTFCFKLLLALARPVLSISPLLHRARQCSILFCSIFILFCLFAFFFGCVIFRQPLALCCAVAGRRRVSARISRLSWHRFIITITLGIAARTIFER